MKKTFKEIRKGLGITARHVARNVLGISYNSLMQKESGSRKFSVSEAKVLCEYYGVAITDVEI